MNRPKEDFPVWSITPTHLHLRDITRSPTLATSFSTHYNPVQSATQFNGGVCFGLISPRDQVLPPNSNGPNVALPTNLTSNNHKAYQCQINSQFFVTQPGIELGTLGKKTSRLMNRPKEDFPVWSITPTHLNIRDITRSPTLATSFSTHYNPVQSATQFNGGLLWLNKP